jgi:hypothetical protein
MQAAHASFAKETYTYTQDNKIITKPGNSTYLEYCVQVAHLTQLLVAWRTAATHDGCHLSSQLALNLWVLT